jgi:hypothetical protein
MPYKPAKTNISAAWFVETRQRVFLFALYPKNFALILRSDDKVGLIVNSILDRIERR